MSKFLQKLTNMVSKKDNFITINGTRTQVIGNNIRVTTSDVSGSKVTVNGVVIVDGLNGGDITIKFEGDVANLVATNVNISGSVIGDVDCTNLKVEGSITGDVDATNVTAEFIKGDVDATSVKTKK